ncbi:MULTISPECIES: AraC family transcriptional regulator [Pseudomonadaceae]|jgi:AraC-like DNA-binding protein|uniref:AraC family transcriptional regulator n=1 Tax=Stutzerimonas stutzeri TaxID=316 RepID=A0A0D9ANP2_STUST|nr:AraC family transcriptional regulator [Stutzerimonas stutzeri]KJH82342.1 AraC family transcriptional regulator [Stutzerimonas stutzeri]
MHTDDRSWITLRQDADTGIETIRAHFEGHAFDPHWHDSYLIGFTEQGVQQFSCRGALHKSTPGQIFLVEPGEIHDGDAPVDGGFTYSMLYLEPAWLARELRTLDDTPLACGEPGFDRTLTERPQLLSAIANAFHALEQCDLRIVRQTALDTLLLNLSGHLRWRQERQDDPRLPRVAIRAREYLHAHFDQDIGLDELAAVTGVSRFRLSRAFKAAFGLAPHAYLIQLRLARARYLLARGQAPAEVASILGFADQSHLGRWFRRAYGLTPAHYRTRCSNLPDD